MARIMVPLPGSIILVPSQSLDAKLAQRRQDHPSLPGHPIQLVSGLNSRPNGVPAKLAPPSESGKDWSLLLYGHAYVARLFPTKRHDAYIIAAIEPLRGNDHQALAEGCLTLRPTDWGWRLALPDVPAGANTYWQHIATAQQHLDAATAAQRGSAPVSAAQWAFLDSVDQVIDATQKIAADETGPYPFRSVAATGGERHGTRSVYDFRLAGSERPEKDDFVRIRGEAERRGQVVGVNGTVVTVGFDQVVDFKRLKQQGELVASPSTVVFDKQRDAVARLRAGHARNPRLLAALVDHQVRPIPDVPDMPWPGLDRDQRRALHTTLRVDDLLVILGPPGTGKTRTISQIAAAVTAGGGVAGHGVDPVLVTSHTNRAVDNVLPRLPKDLVVVRVGNERKVTAEGMPFLLEKQASDLREEILRSTSRRNREYSTLDDACQWHHALGRHLGDMKGLFTQDAQLRGVLEGLRRSYGGPLHARVVELGEGCRAAERISTRAGNRADRTRRARDATHARAGLPVIGIVFLLAARLCDRRLAARTAKASELLGTLNGLRGALAQAEAELDAAIRQTPEAQDTFKGLGEIGQRIGRSRAEATEAARAMCKLLTAIPAVVPPVPNRSDAVGLDRALHELQAWAAAWLPILRARQRLITSWHQDVSGATEQLHPELIRYAHVIAATCIGAASRSELAGVNFELAIVDEAGQIGIPNALVPLARARRAVLVGDDQQLPPFLDSEVENWGKGIADRTITGLLSESVLEILRRRLPGTHVVPLTMQRRMPTVIADFVSDAFYQGNLKSDPESRREYRSTLFHSPMVFVDTARLPGDVRREKPASRGERWGQRGFENPAEADLVVELAGFYHRHGADWAVIVPYKAQKAKIARALGQLGLGAAQIDLNVGTVDSFQGGEREVIIYGFTRSNADGNIGFLKEQRRLNVAITRAQHQLILVGDMSTLTNARDKAFRDLAASLRDHVARNGEIVQYQPLRERLRALMPHVDGTKEGR